MIQEISMTVLFGTSAFSQDPSHGSGNGEHKPREGKGGQGKGEKVE